MVDGWYGMGMGMGMGDGGGVGGWVDGWVVDMALLLCASVARLCDSVPPLLCCSVAL